MKVTNRWMHFRVQIVYFPTLHLSIYILMQHSNCTAYKILASTSFRFTFSIFLFFFFFRVHCSLWCTRARCTLCTHSLDLPSIFIYKQCNIKSLFSQLFGASGKVEPKVARKAEYPWENTTESKQAKISDLRQQQHQIDYE